jgi:alpha-tubulin suppressor-like RCC1 family protein
MRRFEAILVIPVLGFLFNGCKSNANNFDFANGSHKYPPAPPPPFDYTSQPTQVYTNPEANFNCLVNDKNRIQIKCWGDNTRGQVSSTGEVSWSAPVTSAQGLPTIFLDADGNIVTEFYNIFGELVKNPNGFPTEITNVAVGKEHVCVSVSDWNIYCWGDNRHNQLFWTGYPEQDVNQSRVHPLTKLSPVTIFKPDTQEDEEYVLPFGAISALTAGSTHTCAVIDDNDIWCWGDNTDGQVSGDGTTVGQIMGLSDAGHAEYSRSLPFTNVTEKGNLPHSQHDYVTELSAGHNFTCAVYEYRLQSEDEKKAAKKFNPQSVWCWGDDRSGQVSGDSINFSVRDPSQSYPTKATKVRGLPTGQIEHLTTGYDHACVSYKDGNIWCWGNDRKAQVSGVHHSESTTPGLTLIQGIPKHALTLSAGDGFNCVAFKDGALWCWGNNEFSVVDGSGFAGSQVQRITHMSLVNESVVLASGAKHICAAFTDGAVSCWGDNENAQVTGNGVASALTPVTNLKF